MIRVIVVIFSVFILNLSLIAQTWSGYTGYLQPLSQIRDMTVFDGELMLSGGFDTVNNFTTGGLITWNGSKLDTLTDGMRNWGYSIFANDSILVLGGSFSNIANTIYDNIVIWKGDSISNLGGQESGGTTTTQAVYILDGTVYFAGGFGALPFLPLSKRVVGYHAITGWTDLNGGTWGGGVDDVQCLGEFNGNLVVGGLFTHAGTPMKLMNNIGIWDGTSWDDLGGGLSYSAQRMVTDTMNNFLYVAGAFLAAGGASTGALARWDGYQWDSVGGYFDGSIVENAIRMYRNELFVGGVPLIPGGQLSNHIMRFDGQDWYNLNGSVNEVVQAMYEYDDTLWVSGSFDTVGVGFENLPTYRLAKWWMPANTHCRWLQSRIYVNDNDPVFKDSVVPFYNNNAYAASWDWSIDGSSTYSNYSPTHTFTDTGWYNIEVIVSQDGCTDTANVSVYVEEPVSVQEPEQVEFKVYPNPSSGQFTLELQAYQNIQVTIRDLQGKQVLNQSLNTTKTLVNTSKWAKGTYILELSSGSQALGSEKIVLK